MNRKSHSILTGLKCSTMLAAFGLLPQSPLLAQSAQPAANAPVDEILVTARKRGAESLQDIGGSIQAIGEQTIQTKAFTGFDDYYKQVPSLASVNKGPGQTQIAIRGVVAAKIGFGQPQAQSTTGMYFDDVPVTSGAFNPDFGLVDIERVEVLRGPQGTLYGASAMSGAIRVIPNMPNLSRIEGSVGAILSNTAHGDWNYQVNGTLNVPITETLAIRGTAYRLSNGGFIDNVYSGEKNYNDDRSYGGRLIATFKPIDEFSVTGMFLYNKLTAHGRPDEYRPGDPELTVTEFFSGVPVRIVANDEDPEQFNVQRRLQTVKMIDELYRDDTKLYALKSEYKFGGANFTLIGSHLDRKYDTVLDDNQRVRGIPFIGPNNAATGDPILAALDGTTKEKKYTLEARIASTGNSGLQWVLGGYYEDFKLDFFLGAPINDLDLALNAIGFLPDGQTSASFFGTPVPDVLFAGDDNSDGKQKAIFGEVTIPLPFLPDEQLKLTLGGRYYDYDVTATKRTSGLVIGPVPIVNTFNIKENGFNPKVAIEYKPSRDLLFYASRAEGFRIGGTNERLPGVNTEVGQQCAAELQTLGITGSTDTYDSDSLTSYELGAKTSWMGGRFQVNAALYHIDWKDIQTNVFLRCGFNIKANESSQVSKGAELEVSARVSDAMALNLGVSYTDATLAKDSEILAARKGDRAPYVPRWNVNAGFDFHAPVGLLVADSDFYVRGDVTYISNSFSEYSVSPSVERLELPEAFLGNLYVGLSNRNWSLGVFVKNIWDERIVTAIDTDRNQPAPFTRARPRTIGLNASVDW